MVLISSSEIQVKRIQKVQKSLIC